MRGNRLRRYIFFGLVLFAILFFVLIYLGMPNIGSALAAGILALIISVYIMRNR